MTDRGAGQAAPVRVVVAKVGLDGHDRGAKTVALALREGGFEVIYAGLRQTPDSVVRTVVDEDADALGVSLLSGAHLEIRQEICHGLHEAGADNVVVMLGGNVPTRDHALLRRSGVHGIFPSGARFDDIVGWLRSTVAERRGAPATEEE